MYKLKKVTKPAEWNFITNYTYKSIRCWMENQGQINKEDLDSNINLLHTFWQKECNIKILVASEDENIFLGFIIWQDMGDDKCNLWYVAVKEAFRSAGLGTCMVEACVAHFKKIKYFFHTHNLNKIQNKLPKKRKQPIRPETQEFFDKLYFTSLYNGLVDLIAVPGDDKKLR